MKKLLVSLFIILFSVELSAASMLTDSEFSDFLTRIKKFALDSEIAKEVDETSVYCNFTSEQVAAVLKAMRFDETRIEYAVKLFEKTVDPQNFYQIFSVFTHETGKDSLITKLPSRNKFSDYTTPYDSSSFAKVLTFVKGFAFDDMKIKYLPVLKAGVYTCEQVETLMKTINGDEMRLKLALALYPRISDYRNLFRVKEAFIFSTYADTFSDKIANLPQFQDGSGENSANIMTYSQFLRELTAAGDNELQLLKNYAAENKIYVADLSTILRTARYTDKAEIIALFYPALTDRQNMRYLKMNFPNSIQWVELLKKLAEKGIYIEE